MSMPSDRFLLATCLGLMCCCASGCGGVATANIPVPSPDPKLSKEIRESSGTATTASAAETEATPVAATTWGNLSGKFLYDGPAPDSARLAITKDEQVCGKHDLRDESLEVGAGGGLKNVVIFLADKKVSVHPDYEATAKDTIKFDNDHCRFEPHIMPMRTSQTLQIHNSDPLSHNSNLTPLGDRPFNQLISENNAVTYQFGKQQNVPVMVTCSIHPWMKGYVFPRDNPYVAVTGEDGSFEIKNLPAGKHDFQVWQEAVNGLAAKPEWKKGKFKLEIKEGDNDLGTIQVSAALFGK
ncbi:MAG TPA: hypothetical protein VHC22_30385 [Pirellulales bacterium]|nr:hypothetical protein [Pirellulales bacterium]